MNTAPIVLFVYNRPLHTSRTIEALRNNALAKESVLYIYSDSARTPDEEQNVAETREYIRSVAGFRHVEIIEHGENRGLAHNIITGVSETISEHKKVIVLEDDLVTSPGFLSFMNSALDYYENSEKVWHISGWNYPIAADGLGDVFFWRVMNCWGWATWEDRWSRFEKDPEQLINTFSASDISRFDLDDSGIFWSQVTNNAQGKADTWAIFWYATLFAHNGLCLNPTRTYVENIGHDGSGENCGNTVFESNTDLNNSTASFIDTVSESETAVSRIREFYKNTNSHSHSNIMNIAQRYVNRLIR